MWLALRRPLPLALLIGAASFALFAWRIAVPHQFVFDEVHYVPAARALVELSHPSNIEHPLLAKSLIALGIMVFGDNPLGWRIMSAVAGAGTVCAMFAISWLVYGRLRPAVLAALLTVLGFTVYVHARIAMLDGFMLAFLTGGMAAAAWAMRAGGWWRWACAAALLGAAVACKWIAGPYVAFAAAGFVALKRDDPRRFPGLRILPALGLLGIVSVATYAVTFAPAFFYVHDPLTLAGLPRFQWTMFERQTQVLPPHTYQSQWWTWPLMLRPIWYLYEPADGAQRGILLIGNPAIMWGGLVAVAACFWGWVKTGTWRLLAPALLWSASVALWALIPKSLGFYYYYFPSSVFIVLAIVAALDHWRARLRHWDEAFVAGAAVLAAHFYPVLSAQALGDPGAFRHWTWLASWV